MGMWGQIASAVVSAGGEVLGGQANKALDGGADNSEGGLRQSPGFHNAGNATDKRGFLTKTNNFLGTQVGGIAKDVAGSFLGDYRQRRNSRNRFKDLRSEGLTAPEIAGSSGGGAVQAQGNTLGSGPMVQAQSQRNFQADQAQKDRDARQKIVETQVGPPRRQVAVKEKMMYWELEKIAVEIMRTQKQMDKTDFDMRVHFPTKFATMAPENILASVIAAKTGVNLEALLSGQKVTPDQAKRMEELYQLTQVVLSKTRREMKGTFDIIKEIAKYSFDNIPSSRLNNEMFNPLTPSFGRLWK